MLPVLLFCRCCVNNPPPPQPQCVIRSFLVFMGPAPEAGIQFTTPFNWSKMFFNRKNNFFNIDTKTNDIITIKEVTVS